jgi:Sec-independent protein secretion pathway components
MTVTFAYGFGTQELLIIGGLVILLFGGAKVPELMRGLGQGIREFKNSVDGVEPTPAPAPRTTEGAAATPVESAASPAATSPADAASGAAPEKPAP